MKNITSHLKWSFLLILTAFITQSCISENNELDPPLDLNSNLENVTANNDGFPLENLRMDPATLKMLADLRAATSKYHKIEAAMADGYVLGSSCVSSPDGGMGYHYVNFGLMNGSFDPTLPEALLYEMDQNGKLRLVAIEFIVVAAPWDEENAGPPMYGSKEFDDHREMIIVDGEPVNAKGGPPFPHYQLHTWVWKHNPSGLYAPFNPNVTCQYSE
jgi:hypothetical protein